MGLVVGLHTRPRIPEINWRSDNLLTTVNGIFAPGISRSKEYGTDLKPGCSLFRWVSGFAFAEIKLTLTMCKEQLVSHFSSAFLDFGWKHESPGKMHTYIVSTLEVSREPIRRHTVESIWT